MKKGLIFALLLAAILSAGCSKKEQRLLVKVATDATWPPMEFVNEQKEIVGFDIDMLQAIAKAGGFDVEIRNAAWDGIFAGLANGSYDAVISSVTITEERKKAMDFSDPYINAGQVVIVKASNDSVTSLDDLVGLEVGAQIGTTGAIAISQADGVILKTYDELGFAISDLVNSRLSAVVADTPIAADYALNKYKNTLKIVGEPFTQEFYGIAIAKGNQVVLNLMNKGLESIKASGELDQLVQKWLK